MPETKDFVADAQRDVRRLRSEEAQLRRTVEGLETKLRQVQEQAEQLESAIRVYREYMHTENDMSVSVADHAREVQPILTTAKFEELTMAEAIKALMEARGVQEVENKELERWLVQVGKLREGNKNNYQLIRQAIRRKDDFRLSAPGVWRFVAKED